VLKAGILRELKTRASYVKPSMKRRLKSKRVRTLRRKAAMKIAAREATHVNQGGR
jgi:ribosomal protein S21